MPLSKKKTPEFSTPSVISALNPILVAMSIAGKLSTAIVAELLASYCMYFFLEPGNQLTQGKARTFSSQTSVHLLSIHYLTFIKVSLERILNEEVDFTRKIRAEIVLSSLPRL